MNIGIDLMGGDNFKEIILAINEFSKQNEKDTIFAFTTNNNKYNDLIDKKNNIRIIITSDFVTMDDDPAFVVRKKKDSTLVVGATYLKDKKIDAFISAGSTGALAAVGIFVVKRMKGISKPGIMGFLPSINRELPMAVLDLGSNIETKPKNLLEYALFATEYMKLIYGIESPTVSLLNIGSEEKKGTDLHKAAYKLLNNDKLNFVGNIEPRDVLTTKNDIIVADGLTGNILLKSIEGTASVFSQILKDIYTKNTITKLSYLPIKNGIEDLRAQMDYQSFGATPIVGVDGLLLKAHGSSNKLAFINAFENAKKLYELNIINQLETVAQKSKNIEN